MDIVELDGEYERKMIYMFVIFSWGLTADIALPETGYQSFIASDIIDHIGKAYLSLDK